MSKRKLILPILVMMFVLSLVMLNISSASAVQYDSNTVSNINLKGGDYISTEKVTYNGNGDYKVSLEFDIINIGSYDILGFGLAKNHGSWLFVQPDSTWFSNGEYVANFTCFNNNATKINGTDFTAVYNAKIEWSKLYTAGSSIKGVYEKNNGVYTLTIYKKLISSSTYNEIIKVTFLNNSMFPENEAFMYFMTNADIEFKFDNLAAKNELTNEILQIQGGGSASLTQSQENVKTQYKVESSDSFNVYSDVVSYNSNNDIKISMEFFIEETFNFQEGELIGFGFGTTQDNDLSYNFENSTWFGTGTNSYQMYGDGVLVNNFENSTWSKNTETGKSIYSDIVFAGGNYVKGVYEIKDKTQYFLKVYTKSSQWQEYELAYTINYNDGAYFSETSGFMFLQTNFALEMYISDFKVINELNSQQLSYNVSNSAILTKVNARPLYNFKIKDGGNIYSDNISYDTNNDMKLSMEFYVKQNNFPAGDFVLGFGMASSADDWVFTAANTTWYGMRPDSYLFFGDGAARTQGTAWSKIVESGKSDLVNNVLANGNYVKGVFDIKGKSQYSLKVYTKTAEYDSYELIYTITYSDGSYFPESSSFMYLQSNITLDMYISNLKFTNELTRKEIDYNVSNSARLIPVKNSYNITYKNYDNQVIDTVSVNEGQTLTPPSPNLRNGYDFEGWKIEEQQYDFNTPVFDNLILTAYYVLKPAYLNVTYANNNLNISAVDGTDTFDYQFWIKTKISNDNSIYAKPQYIWQLKQNYGIGLSLGIDLSSGDDYIINGKYEIIVRIKDNGSFLKEIHGVFKPNEIQQTMINDVRVNGVSGETLYVLNKEDATAQIDIFGNGAENTTYSLSGLTSEAVESNTGEFEVNISGLENGYYNLKAIADNGTSIDEKNIKVYIYGEYKANEIAVIKSLTGTSQSDGNTEFIMQLEYADGNDISLNNAENYEIALKSEGQNVFFNNTFRMNGETLEAVFTKDYAEKYGIYRLNGTVKRKTVTGEDDSIIVYYDGYARTSTLSQVVSAETAVAGTTLTISAEGGSIKATREPCETYVNPVNLRYAFYREDASGWVLIKEYGETSSDNTLIWTPTKAGIYNIQIRIKDKDAGSYEKAVNRTYTITGGGLSGELTINAYDYITGETALSYVTGRPYEIKAEYAGTETDVLYMFTIYNANDKLKYLNSYTTSNSIMFAPKKNDEYIITVRVINVNSFGYKDLSKEIIINTLN